MTDNRVLHLVDDDEAIRHSASFMLRHEGFVVKTYESGTVFIEQISADDHGCILLDVRMPQMDGLEVQAVLNEMHVDMPIIILTGHGDVSVAVKAMKAGAVDFVQKPYEKQALLASINAAFSGVDDRQSQSSRKREAEASLARLTPRESEVLARLVDGLTNKEIANDLSISARTVEIHRANLMEKLSASSLSAALKIAFVAGVGFGDSVGSTT